MKKLSKNFIHISNGPKPKPSAAIKPWFSVRNEASADCAEIMIYSQIGKSWYDEDGIGAKDFDAALKAIPTSRNILVRINSQGGNVWDGLAIYNMLKARGERVTTRAEGVAASIASVIFMAGHKREMPANALLMVHEPSALLSGNAEEMRKTADMLDKHGDAIAGVYAEHCDKTADEMREYMRAETWFTGAEAQEIGLCDDVTAEVALAACVKDFDLSDFQRVPEVLAKLTKQTPAVPGEAQTQNIMNRQQIIALLAEHGINVDNSISDADLQAKLKEALKPKAAATPAPAPSNIVDIAALQNSLTTITNRLEGERKTRIDARVRELQPNRFPVAQVENWIKRAMADETVLNELADLPVHGPGGEPVNALPVEITSESPVDVEKWVVNQGTPSLTRRLLAGADITPVAIRNAAMATARVIQKNSAKLIGVMNTNTVSTDLKRQVILNDMIRAFKRRVLACNAFFTTYSNVPLLGTNEVAVPYYPLDTSASKDFVAADGYVFDKNTTTSSKKITVDQRKYQPFDFSSDDFRRQPYFNVQMLAALKAEQLGIDVVNNIFSIVTAANYGDPAFTGVAAAFNYEAVADLRTAANQANWPTAGRSLVIDSAYDGNLVKDSKIASALNFNGDVAQSGVIPRIVGFDYHETPGFGLLTGTPLAEHLKGFIAFKSAGLVAFSPIMPTPGVLKQLVSYDISIDPDSGVVMEYRYWGEPQKDGDREVIESNFGKQVGEAAAAKRIIEQ